MGCIYYNGDFILVLFSFIGFLVIVFGAARAGVEAGVEVGASPSKTSSPKTEPGPSSRGGGAPPTTSMPRAGDTQRRRLPCTTTLSPLPWPPSRATTE